MHKFDKCAFYFYANNWSSHSTTINLFRKGRDLLPHSHNFLFSLGFMHSRIPGPRLLSYSGSLHSTFSVPSPLILLISYPQNPSLPSYIHLQESPLDLANILIYFFFPSTGQFLKYTICTSSFYLPPLVWATTWLKKWPPNDQYISHPWVTRLLYILHSCWNISSLATRGSETSHHLTVAGYQRPALARASSLPSPHFLLSYSQSNTFKEFVAHSFWVLNKYTETTPRDPLQSSHLCILCICPRDMAIAQNILTTCPWCILLCHFSGSKSLSLEEYI